jgi:alpha-glucosidase
MGVSSAYADVPKIDLAHADDLTKLRTLQQSLMMPVARVSFAPWRISNKTYFEEYMRNLRLRCQMGSHLQQVAEEGIKTAEPMARHMEYLFPRSGFADCSTQYMLGDKYQIAPPSGDGKRMVRLPRGVWTDTDGKRYRGPVVINADTSNGKLLCFELN